MSKEIEVEGYCLKCKEKRIMEDPRPEWALNGSPATRGTCPECGTNMYKRGYTELHDDLPKPDPEVLKERRKKRRKKRARAAVNGKRSGKLVVVESPAKAKTIGRYLGKGYTVKSSVGHVRDLLKSRLSVDLENDYQPEYRVPNDKRSVIKDLRLAAAKAEEIFLATDRDREGEAIAWHVMESADMEPERTKRVVFQEITKSAILEAFKSPTNIDMDRVNAQQARRILDRLVGYKLSPLLWRKVRGRLSAGRVQSVAVRLVVEREREIDAFDPEEYWSIQAELSQVDGRGVEPRPYFTGKLHRLNGEEPVLPSEEVVQPHVDALQKAVWHVGEVRLGQRRRKPAAPFTTSTMQQEASRKLNFGTSKTMRVAQQLYEGIDVGGEDGSTGLITYMRTDSVNVSEQAQTATREYVVERYGQEYIPEKPRRYTTKSKGAQEAHEAIRPTVTARTPEKIKKHLSRDQFRLYKLIWERFVASQMSRAVYDTVSTDIYAGEATVAIKKRPYMFRATGSTLRFAGFLILYEETEPEDRPDDGENVVPTDLEADEPLDLLQLLPQQHFTQPPARYSEATLVKELESNGIGRPSTYASIISTIQKRGYVDVQEKRLVPTEIGEVVTDLLVEYFPNVLSVDFTARLEGELDTIADGEPWVPIIDGFYRSFEQNLETADEEIEKVDIKKEPEPVGRACPECGNELLYRTGRYGRFIGCSNFPKCRYTEQILVKTGVTCPQCHEGDIVERHTRRGRIFYGCTNYPDCDWTSWKKPVPQKCPECGGVMVVAKKGIVRCINCKTEAPLKAQEPEPA